MQIRPGLAKSLLSVLLRTWKISSGENGPSLYAAEEQPAACLKNIMLLLLVSGLFLLPYVFSRPFHALDWKGR
jgi:hypothetical protein